MNKKEMKISSENIYSGKIIDVYVDKVKCPNGKISTRELIRHCEACCILAFVDDNHIIIEKQYRYPYDDFVYELPAGKVDKNENIEKAAIRELEEETGYLAKNLKYLGKMYPSCAYTDEIIHLYLAKDLIKTQQRLDENEFLEYEIISLNDFIEMIRNNKIFDAKTLCAIALYSTKIASKK